MGFPGTVSDHSTIPFEDDLLQGESELIADRMRRVAKLACANLTARHSDEQVVLPLDHLDAVHDEHVIEHDRAERFQIAFVTHWTNLNLRDLHHEPTSISRGLRNVSGSTMAFSIALHFPSSSKTVTPSPPWFGGAKSKHATKAHDPRYAWIAARRVPVPLPWRMLAERMSASRS